MAVVAVLQDGGDLGNPTLVNGGPHGSVAGVLVREQWPGVLCRWVARSPAQVLMWMVLLRHPEDLNG